MKGPGSVAFTFRMRRHAKEALEKAAKDDLRTISGLLEKIVTDWLIERRYINNAHERHPDDKD